MKVQWQVSSDTRLGYSTVSRNESRRCSTTSRKRTFKAFKGVEIRTGRSLRARLMSHLRDFPAIGEGECIGCEGSATVAGVGRSCRQLDPRTVFYVLCDHQPSGCTERPTKASPPEVRRSGTIGNDWHTKALFFNSERTSRRLLGTHHPLKYRRERFSLGLYQFGHAVCYSKMSARNSGRSRFPKKESVISRTPISWCGS